MRLQIKDIATHLPEKKISNEDILKVEPKWDMNRVAERTGVISRHRVREDETALDLAQVACEKLYAKNQELLGRVGAIIFCTQSPDYIMPPNSCLLHARLKLSDEVAAFDFNLACSGYPYGLAIANGLMHTGVARDILLVTADTYSKYISPKDRSVYALFGDGAAVSWLSLEDSPSGLIDVILATFGSDAKAFMIEAGGCRLPKSPATSLLKPDIAGNQRSQEHIHMRGVQVLEFVRKKIPAQVEQLLKRNGLSLQDIALVIPHQASRAALDELEKILNLPSEKCYRNMTAIGNTVSASIPMALHDATREGRLRTGDLVLLVGFGVGLSYACALLRCP